MFRVLFRVLEFFVLLFFVLWITNSSALPLVLLTREYYSHRGENTE